VDFATEMADVEESLFLLLEFILLPSDPPPPILSNRAATSNSPLLDIIGAFIVKNVGTSGMTIGENVECAFRNIPALADAGKLIGS
jgi:hypothetical protein